MSNGDFCYRKKVVFTRDYSIDFPLSFLQNRVLERFAPPIQQFTHVLDGLFRKKKVPEDVVPFVLGYLFAWNEPRPVYRECATFDEPCQDDSCLHPQDFTLPMNNNVRELRRFPKKPMFKSLQEFDELFEEYSFGMISKVGKTLSISLPKEFKQFNSDFPTSMSKFMTYIRYGVPYVQYLPSLSLSRKFFTYLLFAEEFKKRFNQGNYYQSLPATTSDTFNFLFTNLKEWWCTFRFNPNPSRIPSTSNLPRKLLNAVLDAENRVTPNEIARVLDISSPIINIAEPHSLEIFVSVRDNGSDREAKKHLGIITVPHDASIVNLAEWIQDWISRENFVEDSDRFGQWCYCYFKDHHARLQKMFDLLSAHRTASLTGTGGIANSIHGGSADPTSKQATQKVADNFTVRVGRIQCNEYTGSRSGRYSDYDCFGYDSVDGDGGDDDDDDDEDDEDDEGGMNTANSSTLKVNYKKLKVPKVTEKDYFNTVAVLGGRRALIDLASRRCSERLDDDDYGLSFGHDDTAEVFFHCAISDVFPPPEENWPSMNSMIRPHLHREGEFTLNPPHSKNFIEFDWDRVFAVCFAVRRVPRLPDKDYPLEKRLRYPPHSYNYL